MSWSSLFISWCYCHVLFSIIFVQTGLLSDRIFPVSILTSRTQNKIQRTDSKFRTDCHLHCLLRTEWELNDFVVHEIDNDGRIIRLTDITAPIQSESRSDVTEEESNDLLSEEQQSQLKQLQESQNVDMEVLIPSSECKDTRTKLHRLIQSTFANLNSNGIERVGKKYIRVTYFSRKERRKPDCFADVDYTKFVLYFDGLIGHCAYIGWQWQWRNFVASWFSPPSCG